MSVFIKNETHFKYFPLIKFISHLLQTLTRVDPHVWMTKCVESGSALIKTALLKSEKRKTSVVIDYQ